HAAENVEQGRLARAGFADDDANVPLVHREADIPQRMHVDVASPVDFADILERDVCAHGCLFTPFVIPVRCFPSPVYRKPGRAIKTRSCLQPEALLVCVCGDAARYSGLYSIVLIVPSSLNSSSVYLTLRRWLTP